MQHQNLLRTRNRVQVGSEEIVTVDADHREKYSEETLDEMHPNRISGHDATDAMCEVPQLLCVLDLVLLWLLQIRR